KAAKVYEGIWKTAPEELRARNLAHYVHTLCKADKSMQAYEQIGPRERTYQTLVPILWQDKKSKELDALVTAHRAKVGDKANFQIEFDAIRAKILLNQPDKAIQLYEAAMKKQVDRFLIQDMTIGFVREMDSAGHGLAAVMAAADKNEAVKVVADSLVRGK